MKISRIVVVSLAVLVAGGLEAADKKSKAKGMEMYNPGPDGKEVKGMEISYKRVK